MIETDRSHIFEIYVRMLKVPAHKIPGTSLRCPGSGDEPLSIYKAGEAIKGPCLSYNECQTEFTLIETFGGKFDGQLKWTIESYE